MDNFKHVKIASNYYPNALYAYELVGVFHPRIA